MVSLDVKQECIRLRKAGMPAKQIYNEYFNKVCPNVMGEHNFRSKLPIWMRKLEVSDELLESGTFNGFYAHNATVQVAADGSIRQAWIKQSEIENQWDDLLTAVKENTSPLSVEYAEDCADAMLEIPLFDMHFPFVNEQKVFTQLYGIISKDFWKEINIVVGQDMFHNDDFRGRTSSGREIEKVDIVNAWKRADAFWTSVIELCVKHSKNVNLIYSKGNHDESLAWCFVKMLECKFPQIHVDSSLKQRKCIEWQGCFIGITHGEYRQNKNQDLRGQFTIQFPEQFARCKVREIHTGHFHHEQECDVYGVMVRRLATGKKLDGWSDDNGYVGGHKRFMVFEWSPDALKSIHYLQG